MPVSMTTVNIFQTKLADARGEFEGQPAPCGMVLFYYESADPDEGIYVHPFIVWYN